VYSYNMHNIILYIIHTHTHSHILYYTLRYCEIVERWNYSVTLCIYDIYRYNVYIHIIVNYVHNAYYIPTYSIDA